MPSLGVCIIERVEVQVIQMSGKSWKGFILLCLLSCRCWHDIQKALENQCGNFWEKLELETEISEPCTWIRGLETLSMAEIAKDKWEQRVGQRAVLQGPATSWGWKRKGRKHRSSPRNKIRMAERPGAEQTEVLQEEDVNHREMEGTGASFWWLVGDQYL